MAYSNWALHQKIHEFSPSHGTFSPSHGTYPLLWSQAIQEKIKEHLDQLRAKARATDVRDRSVSLQFLSRWCQSFFGIFFLGWKVSGRKNTGANKNTGKETKMAANKKTMVTINK